MPNSRCSMPPLCILHRAFRIQHSPRCGGWWRQSDSNRRHPACKADALPTELCPLARKAGSDSKSVCAKDSRSFWEAKRASSLRHVSPGRLHAAQTWAAAAHDELTIGIPVARVRLLRKEVIQPQVPLRLPCYDFIPITTHTLGDSLPCGLGRRLRVQTAFMM